MTDPGRINFLVSHCHCLGCSGKYPNGYVKIQFYESQETVAIQAKFDQFLCDFK